MSYGLTRFNAVQELAEMVDEANRDLRDAVRAVLDETQRNGGGPAVFHVAHLHRVFSAYEPIVWPSAAKVNWRGSARRRCGPGKNLSLHCKVARSTSV